MRPLPILRNGVTITVVLALALLSASVLLSLAGCACDATPQSVRPGVGVIEAVLVKVIDGDTIRVRMPGGAVRKVRYIGIDAPEVARGDSPGEYLGDEATAHNSALLRSGPLRMETDVDEWDDFGRLLAYVWAGDVFVNERMVSDGYARARNYPPNLARQDRLWEAHDKARAAGIGIWDRRPDE